MTEKTDENWLRPWADEDNKDSEARDARQGDKKRLQRYLKRLEPSNELNPATLNSGG